MCIIATFVNKSFGLENGELLVSIQYFSCLSHPMKCSQALTPMKRVQLGLKNLQDLQSVRSKRQSQEPDNSIPWFFDYISYSFPLGL